MTHGGEDQLVGDGVDDRRGGGAAVEKHRVVFIDQRRRQQADAPFLRHLLGFLIGNEVVGDAVAARIGHHVAAEQHHRRRFGAQIAANGHLRDPQQHGGFFQVDLVSAF